MDNPRRGRARSRSVSFSSQFFGFARAHQAHRPDGMLREEHHRMRGASLFFALLAGACLELGCDAPADELTDGRSRVGGSHSSSDETTADDDDSTTSTTSSASTGTNANAQALFEQVRPKLAQNCGPCHTKGDSRAPIWLDPASPYASIKGYKGIVVADPASSLLITKPAHEGPALDATLAASVKTWLSAEVSGVAQVSTKASTAAVAIPSGAGSITLPSPGGTLGFTASLANGILTLSNVALVAPATSGVHATGVHIVIVHAGGTRTTNDSLADADTTAAAGAKATVGVGLVVIPRVETTDQLALDIDSLSASTGGTTTTTAGGCKSVASFQTNAAPALKANCMNCHNTGGSGFGALDLSALAAATPDFAKACGQAKSKIDTANPAQSPLITAPTGGDAAHPYKNAPASYKTSVTTWINAEK